VKMRDTTPRMIKIGDAMSQLVNVAVLPNHKDTTAKSAPNLLKALAVLAVQLVAFLCAWLLSSGITPLVISTN
jgi:hypothetical protein